MKDALTYLLLEHANANGKKIEVEEETYNQGKDVDQTFLVNKVTSTKVNPTDLHNIIPVPSKPSIPKKKTNLASNYIIF